MAQEAYNGSMVKVSVGVSAGSSKEQQDYRSQEEQGTHLVAGETVRLDADKDIVGRGVSIAGKNVALDAGRDITLSAAQDTEKEQSRSSGNQFSAGVGFSLIGQQNGFSIEIGASRSQSKMEGNSLVNHNSEVRATDTLTVNSERDTTLQGASLHGERVVADVGRNLTISSQQDSAEYHSRSNSTGLNLSICVPPICAGASSASSAQGSMDISSGRMNNEYRAVIDQSGVFAGKGGFDIFVGNHTQLDGAVIASDAEAAKNRLSTDTLGWSDIENWAESSGSQYALSVSGGVGKSRDTGGMTATTGGSETGAYQGSSGGKPSMSMSTFTQRVTSTTHSAVAEGDVMVRDSASQQQDVATLSRDTANAHSALENNFDRNSIRDKLEIQQQATSLATQAMTAYAESRQNAAKQQAREEMAASGELDGLSEPEIERRVLASPTFKAAESEYGVGSPFWTAGSSVSGLLAGVLGGNVQSGAAASAAPVLAKLIKDASGDDHEGARIALHTLASAVLAKAQGGSAEAGAVGGFIAAAGAKMFAQALYGKDAGELGPDEKTVILNLVAALGAAGGGVATGDTSGMVSAGNAARIEVENNYLKEEEARQFDKEMQECKASGRDCNKVIEKYIAISNKNSKEVVEACTGGGVTCVTWEELIQADTNVALDANKHQIRLSEKLKDPDAVAIVKYLNGKDLKFLKDNITTGDRVMDVIMTPTSWPVAVMGGKAIITNAVNNTKEQLIAVGVAGTASAGIQYGMSGDIKLSDAIGAGVIGAITAGKGYNPTMMWNAAGSYYQAEISGDDPFMAALMSKAGASAGYVAGNIIKVPMDKVLNPVSKQYEWVPTGVWTISKPVSQHPLPSIVGNMGDSAASELVPKYLEKKPEANK